MADSYATEFARKGGKARAKKLTPEERSESARKAVEARWAKLRETVRDISERSKALEKRATLRAKPKKEKVSK